MPVHEHPWQEVKFRHVEPKSSYSPADHWRCPINIDGLHPNSIKTFFDDKLFTLLQPTVVANDPSHVFQTERGVGKLCYGNLTKKVEQRIRDLTAFLRQAALIAKVQAEKQNSEAPLVFQSLAGDSHNGGKRPLLFQFKNQPMVLKFADPRPHQLLGDVLKALSTGIGVDLVAPSIKADRRNQWYLMPFLNSRKSKSNIEADQFTFALGALTAVAYSLRMVDLHLENILVSDGKPIIIDPECILYNFIPDAPNDRLLSTGLLSHNPALSAIRGGDLSKQKVVQIDAYIRKDGVLDYNKPVDSFHNRLQGRSGQLVDPSVHRKSLIGGFINSYQWMMSHKGEMKDIICHWVQDDFRIRYLARKTKLYTATIHMLNLPVSCAYEQWREAVLSQYLEAGHFPEKLSDAMIKAEINDLDARDVPYFWVNAGEPAIYHNSGPCQEIEWDCPVLSQGIIDIGSLSISDMNL